MRSRRPLITGPGAVWLCGAFIAAQLLLAVGLSGLPKP
jgi:hypothetical protein